MFIQHLLDMITMRVLHHYLIILLKFMFDDCGVVTLPAAQSTSPAVLHDDILHTYAGACFLETH